MSESMPSAALVAIGDELLAGAHPDLNSPALAAGLAELGWRVTQVVVVGDDELRLAEVLAELCARHRLVVASGGLGPTLDDVTRHAAARAAGRELVISAEALAQIRAWYAQLGREMPASNERQALVPEGATVLANPAGTAPGFRVGLGGSWLVVLPGPPRELAAMLACELLPWLAGQDGDGLVRRTLRFHLVGLPESTFADRAGSWMERDANPLMGVTVEGSVMTVRLVASAADEAGAEALLAERGAAFRERFGEFVFSEDEPDPAIVLGRRLIEQGISVTAAESCTGGLLAAALTRTPGISAVLGRSFVTYADPAKSELLGVPPALIARHGAVSLEVAEAMARGAAERAGARLALSTTGIAGPQGGSERKPVGLVCFGLALDGQVTSEERLFPAAAGRERIREWATAWSLGLALRRVGERSPALP